MDQAAVNFRPVANVADCPPGWVRQHGALGCDTGCIYEGCLDSHAVNYDASATVSGCCTPRMPGCTDSQSVAVSAFANTDDGSCVTVGCTDSSRSNFDSLATFDDGLCTPQIPGCTNSGAGNFHPVYNVDDGSCRFPGCTDTTSLHFSPIVAYNDGCSCAGACGSSARRHLAARGCMDTYAYTHDPATTENDVSACSYDIFGCTDSSTANFVPEATAQLPGDVCEHATPGCTIPSARNFDSRATTLAGCTFWVSGCSDSLADFYRADANIDDGSCTYLVEGCMEGSAYNFDSAATLSAGCRRRISGCADSAALNYASDVSESVPTACAYVDWGGGCMFPAALNYESNATRDDGSCFLGSPPPSLPPPPTPPSPPPPPLPPPPSSPDFAFPTPSSSPTPPSQTMSSASPVSLSPAQPMLEASDPPLNPPSLDGSPALIDAAGGGGGGGVVFIGIGAVVVVIAMLCCCRRRRKASGAAAKAKQGVAGETVEESWPDVAVTELQRGEVAGDAVEESWPDLLHSEQPGAPATEFSPVGEGLPENARPIITQAVPTLPLLVEVPPANRRRRRAAQQMGYQPPSRLPAPQRRLSAAISSVGAGFKATMPSARGLPSPGLLSSRDSIQGSPIQGSPSLGVPSPGVPSPGLFSSRNTGAEPQIHFGEATTASTHFSKWL